MATPVKIYEGPGATEITTGYIIDDKTYLDEAGTQRVPIGTIVMTDNGHYILTDQGGMLYSDYSAAVASGKMSPENVGRISTNAIGTSSNTQGTSAGASGSSGVNATADAYIQDIYDAQIAANQAALENAYELNVNTINAQKEALPGTYQAAKNETAAQAQIQKSNFNEYASAAGLSSGAGGQAQLSMSNALQGNLSSLDKAQADALAQLDLQLTNLTTQYQNDLALAFAEGNLAKVAALYESYQSNKAALIDQQQFDASNNNTLYSRALTTAQFTGIFDGMAAYGWTQEEIEAAEQNWQAVNG